MGSDIASILTSAALLVSAVGSVLATILGLHNRRGIADVKEATNGMKAELVEEVRTAALAKGNLEGRAEEKASANGEKQ